MANDLYQELGVNPDAGMDDLKKAHRAIVKRVHPDSPDGDRDAFERAQLAYDVLSNPERRQRYDQTGSHEGATIDYEYTQVLKFVTTAFDEAIRSTKDVKRNNIIAAVNAFFSDRRRTGDNVLNMARQEIERLKVVRERLGFTGTGENVVDGLIGGQIGEHERTLVEMAEQLGILEKARALVRQYNYRIDEMPPTPAAYAGTPQPGFVDMHLPWPPGSGLDSATFYEEGGAHPWVRKP